MIKIEEVEKIHEILVENFGGAKGIRDKASLESAINRPYQTFGGVDLYANSIEKAAALFESIISNHPFIDGNKRTAYVLMRLLLKEGGFDLKVSEEAKYNFVISAAKGELTFEDIKKWIQLSIQ
jgi:death on curing protein